MMVPIALNMIPAKTMPVNILNSFGRTKSLVSEASPPGFFQFAEPSLVSSQVSKGSEVSSTWKSFFAS
jgi:hypothetical protein